MYRVAGEGAVDELSELARTLARDEDNFDSLINVAELFLGQGQFQSASLFMSKSIGLTDFLSERQLRIAKSIRQSFRHDHLDKLFEGLEYRGSL
jgi:hypothetical protein